MLSKKILSLGLTALLSASLLVGCGSEFDSTEYLDKQGKQLIKKYEDREKYDYIKVESLEPFVSEDMYKDKYIMITGKVTDIKEEGQACYEISFDFKENHTIDFIRVFINKNMIDVKFNKGDTITVYGRCNGIQTKRYDDESFDYWHISAYFLELGDTTNKDINTKDTTDNKDVATEIQPQKKVTVNVSEQATDKPHSTPKGNSKKSYQKDTNQNETKSTQKKSNENTTKEDKKEEPKQEGYYITCPNGHKVWTVNGDYDCQQCYDDWQEQQEADDTEEYEDGFIKDATQLGENEWNYDDYSEESIQEADDVEIDD